MKLDFQRIKEIRIVEVLGRYHIPLKFQGVWGSAVCPLPSHKQGEKERSFSVNTEQNYWKCFSSSCNEKAGKKGGDVINFVALMENCSQLDAAKKLAEWFNVNPLSSDSKPLVNKEKPPAHMEQGASETKPQKATSDNNGSSDSVKDVPAKGYMGDVDAWFTELFKRQEKEVDCDYWKRVRNGVKARLVLSYRNGKRVAEGLQPQAE